MSSRSPAIIFTRTTALAINDESTYYDILDLKPDASPAEVREAYLRTKGTYNKDSVALYTLISTDEREEMLRKIEEAYEVLSSSERRKEYDRHHGLLSAEEEMVSFGRQRPNKKIISIDRVPPMDSGGSLDDLLVAPATDFTGTSGGFFGSTEAPLPTGGGASTMKTLTVDETNPGLSMETRRPAPTADASTGGAGAGSARSAAPDISMDIAREADWHGSFIRRIREARRVSVEELASVTKITKTYIQAIEDENFGRLPAAVYLRGFIIQIAKVLKLPHEKVAGGYMARYYQARPDQAR